jgi:hypothetical protein
MTSVSTLSIDTANASKPPLVPEGIRERNILRKYTATLSINTTNASQPPGLLNCTRDEYILRKYTFARSIDMAKNSHGMTLS